MIQDNSLETRVLALESLVSDLWSRLLAVERRLAADEQQMAQSYANPYLSPPSSGNIQAAVLTGTLATGTLASPSSASATLYTESVGAWTSGGSITVKNTYALSASIASGKQVWVENVNGTYYALTSEC